jgi:TonB-linked SusC/RagA family outer membrane protein
MQNAHSNPAINEKQNVSIRIVGEVTDSYGPVIGANIALKGTTVGAVTDIDGNYILSAPADGVLVFSYLGYETQEVKIDGRTSINVLLSESVSNLDEVVIVGYGAQRKISMIGAQSGIKNVGELKQPVATLSSVLAGRISGVIGLQRTGEAGRDDNTQIWVRGVSTTTNATPLILVDGVERSFVNIDPEDVESFQVLKDASATAVYGVRGANGVILINTKKGTKTKPRIKVEYNYGITSFTKVPELADGVTYMQMANEASMNQGKAPIYSEEQIRKTYTQEDPYLYPNVNWTKELFKQNAYNQKLNVNTLGGSEFAQYYVSLGYYNEGGLYNIRRNERYDGSMDFHRINFVSNLTMQVTKTTEVELGVNGEISDYNTPYYSAEDVFKDVLISYPILFPVTYPDKKIPYINNGGNVLNPYAMVYRMGSNMRNTSETRTNLNIKQNLDFWLKGLSARALVSYDFYMRNDIQRPGTNPIRYQATGRDANGELILQRTDPSGSGNNNWDYNKQQWGHRQYYLESALNYDQAFDKHRVSGMFLYNMTDYSNVTAGKLIHAIPFRNLGIAGRITYSYNDRYFGEANFGYNGAENFTPKKRFGFFPSFGLAWVPTNEKFMQSLTDKIQLLKFRFSWGQAGNSVLDNERRGENNRRFIYLSTVGGGNGYTFGTNGQNGYGGVSVGDIGVDVTWETSTKTNLGMDLNLLNNDLFLQFDVFKEHRENIFLTRGSIPDYMGLVNLPLGNFGIVENKGFEVTGDFAKKLGEVEVIFKGNFSYSQNQWIEDDQPVKPYSWLNAYGHSLNTKFGYICDGFYSQADIDNPDVAKPMGITVKPGDLKYRNLNPDRDNVIDANDKTYIGYPEVPRIVYGFGTTFGYKNFMLGIFFQGVGQRDISLSATNFTPFRDSSTNGNLYANVVDRWNPDHPSDDALWPRLDYGLSSNTENYANSTFWLHDGSYLRLKTLDFSYTIPKDITKKWGVSNLRFYVLAYNLLTFTKFDMWDVELNPGSNGMAYPNLKTYSAGLSFSF